jgi:hypothetical protein
MSIMGFLEKLGCNEGALFAIKRAMEAEPLLRVTIPTIVADNLLILKNKRIFSKQITTIL